MKGMAHLTLVLLLAAATTTFGGCVSRQAHKSLTVKNELVSYHIEYPRLYNRDGPRVDLENISPACYLYLTAPAKRIELLIPGSGGNGLKPVVATYVPACITVDVHASVDSPICDKTAQQALEGYVSQASKWEHFNLIERSPVTVSGVSGGLVAYVEDWFLPFADSDPDQPRLKYFRIVAFDHGGYIWEIIAESEMDMADQVKVDLEHILQTFKILD